MDVLNLVVIVLAILLIAFWLGVAFCFVVLEPQMQRRARAAMERRYRARITALERRVDVQIVAEAFRAGREEVLPVIEGESE